LAGSRIPGFYRLSPRDRAQRVVDHGGLGAEDLHALESDGLALAQADAMIENVVSVYGLPMGIATNMVVNGREYLVPMVVEEPSVVAGLSYAARLAREGGGFAATADAPEMIGQMQILDLADPAAARLDLLDARARILEEANRQDPVIVGLGGGARDIVVRLLPDSPIGPMLALHLIYDVRDAMGANAINTALEALTPLVEAISGGRVGLRILSNLADRRLARARCVVPKTTLAQEGVGADEAVSRILEAYAFAVVDPYRAATHNKGIMNGVDAVAVATGNDWRAIEAGAHAYAARDGHYRPLTSWERNGAGDLVGAIELPIVAGTVGGATRAHPQARLALRILGVGSAVDLATVMAATGLGQNLAALRALALEGIQRGHMKLHARQVAMAGGASGEMIDRVAARLVAEGVIRVDHAEALLRELGANAEGSA
jgi:hydroxymethylglutaryl-CoA reductase